jgi:hypothetical protein
MTIWHYLLAMIPSIVPGDDIVNFHNCPLIGSHTGVRGVVRYMTAIDSALVDPNAVAPVGAANLNCIARTRGGTVKN